MKPTSQQMWDAMTLMQRMGGGFASRLADAWFHADMQNKRKIENEFADLIAKFLSQV